MAVAVRGLDGLEREVRRPLHALRAQRGRHEAPAGAARVDHARPRRRPRADRQADRGLPRCTRASCSIWAVDLASGDQRKVAGLGTIRRGNSAATPDLELGLETHPRIWGDRVAFQTGPAGKTQLRIGPSAAGRGSVKTLPGRPARDGLLTQLAIGPKHVVGLWEANFCRDVCTGVYIDGIASGRQQRLDAAPPGEFCFTFLDALRFDGRAFR